MKVQVTGIWWALTMLLIVTAMSPSIALAEEQDELSFMDSGEMFMTTLQVIFALLFIIALIILLLRFLGKKSKMIGANKGMQHLAGMQLGQHKSLQLIEVGPFIYVLGIGEDVHLIDKIEDPELVELIKQQMSDVSPFPGSPFKKFKAIWGGSEPSSNLSQENENTTTSFQEMFYEKVHHVNENKKKKLDEWLTQDDQKEER